MSGTRQPGQGHDSASFRILARQLEKQPPCQAQCPNSGDIRGWLGIIAQHEKSGLTLDEAYDAAWEKLAERNPLPATIGRICPHPCEDLCTRRDKDGAVSINAMERYLGDGAVVLASPIGYSPTGEVFNLRAEDVATAIAVELHASKLLFLTETEGLQAEDGSVRLDSRDLTEIRHLVTEMVQLAGAARVLDDRVLGIADHGAGEPVTGVHSGRRFPLLGGARGWRG